MKMSAERVESYLVELSQHGVRKWAAAVASPHLAPGSSAHASFISLAKRDAAFAEREREAIAMANARIEHKLVELALTGQAEPLMWRGEHVGEKRVIDPRVGMWLLSRRSPDEFGEKREVELTGGAVVRHEHSAAPISLHDIGRLSPAQRQQLRGVLETVIGNRALPSPIPDEDDAVEAEYSEVGD